MMPVSSAPKPGGHTMYMEIIWKAALLTLTGLSVAATVVTNDSFVARSSTESEVATRGAAANSVRSAMSEWLVHLAAWVAAMAIVALMLGILAADMGLQL
jgi:hypothetical protein